MVSSPDSRRSPRLARHGLHPDPPSKEATDAMSRSGGQNHRSESTATPIKGTSRAGQQQQQQQQQQQATPSPVIPFFAATTPTPPSARRTPKKSPGGSTGKAAVKEMAALGQTTARRTRRKRAALSPRTRGMGIASILASPGEVPLANGAAGIANRFVSPSKRSSAEAALNRLARAAVGARQRAHSLDSGTVSVFGATPKHRRRRRKAASDAHEKVRGICEMEEFDDLPGSADKIPYNKGAGRKKRAKSGLEGQTTQSATTSSSGDGDNVPAGKTIDKAKDNSAATEAAQSATSAGDGNLPPVTVDTYKPKNKRDEKWFSNFKKWSASQTDGASVGDADTSPLPKGWAQQQRAQHRLMEQGKKSSMTRERVTLLEGVGFPWEVRGGRRPRGSAEGEEKNAASGAKLNRTSTDGEGRRGPGRPKGTGKASVDVSPSAREALRRSFGSPSERKSPRKSPPTQFYHHLDTASSDKEKGGDGQPPLGTPTKSATKRKSPRKSPPTQFYHNLGSALSDNNEGAGGARKSLLPKLNEAKKVGDAKGKPVSPSKRLSDKSQSLASASAKAESKSQKKKKKRRFRGSTSSMSALGVPAEVPASDGKEDTTSKKGKGLFGYKELVQVLKKSKKRPITKKEGEEEKKPSKKRKTKASNDKAKDGKKGTNAAVDDKAPAPSMSSIENKAAGGNSRTAVAKENAPFPSTPASSSNKDASTDQETDPQSVCVTKLLLSCLSEDSAEKVSTSMQPKDGPSDKIKSSGAPNNVASQSLMSKSDLRGEQTPLVEIEVTQESSKQPAANDPQKKGGEVTVSEPSEPVSMVNEPKRSSPEKNIDTEQPTPTQMDADERVSSWTCDVCHEATFDDYDDAVTQEKACLGGESSSFFPEQEEATSQLDNQAPGDRQNGSWTCDVCQEATFKSYDEAVAHERECASSRNPEERVVVQMGEAEKPASALKRPAEPSPLSEKQSTIPAVNEHTHQPVANQADSQPTPTQLRGPVDEAALAQFSPLSLTSPLQANNLLESRYGASNHKNSSPSVQLNSTQFHPVTASAPNPTSMNLVSHVNLNLSLPAGILQTGPSDSQLQMVLAERQYQEKMAEFGRLELEAKMVTDRMREIEDRMQSMESNAISADVTLGRRIEESVSRKRSYHSETHRYESSEGEDSRRFHSPRKRRRRYESEEKSIKMKKVKVRSRSSRKGGEQSSRSSYDNEEIVMQSSSKRSNKADRRRAASFDLPSEKDERVDTKYRSHGTEKRSKGKRKSQSGGKLLTSRVRKSSPRRKQKSSLEVDLGEATQPLDETVDDGSSTKSVSKEATPQEERTELAEEKESGTAPTKQSGKEQMAANKSDAGAPSQLSNSRDPLYWLAGGENSSDEESWDFDGPMILPPPPI